MQVFQKIRSNLYEFGGRAGIRLVSHKTKIVLLATTLFDATSIETKHGSGSASASTPVRIPTEKIGTSLLSDIPIFGGRAGIRTLDTSLPAYTISSRAPSTSSATLPIAKV